MRIVNVTTFACLAFVLAGCTTNRPVRYTSTPVQRDVISAPPPRYEVYQPVRSGTGGEVITSGSASRPAIDDRELAIAVRREFDRYGDLGRLGSDITINAHNGTVTLTGDVPTQRDKQMIEALVRNTSGVVDVNNLLLVNDPYAGSVQPTGRSDEPSRVYARPMENINLHVQGLADADRRLGQQILAQLQSQNAFVSPNRQVDIYVENGTVTLRGAVGSEGEKLNLAAAVRRAAGVEVRNELTVR